MAAPIVGSWGFLGVAAEFWFRCSLISLGIEADSINRVVMTQALCSWLRRWSGGLVVSKGPEISPLYSGSVKESSYNSVVKIASKISCNIEYARKNRPS